MTDRTPAPEGAKKTAKPRAVKPAAPAKKPAKAAAAEPMAKPVKAAAEVAPVKPAKPRAAKPAKAPTGAVQPELPVAPAPEPVRRVVPIQVVGEDTPGTPSRTAESGSRHEAVEFDPGAIFARFAPKSAPVEPPAPVVAPEPTRREPEPVETSAQPERVADATPIGTWDDAPAATAPAGGDDRPARRDGRDGRQQNQQPGGNRGDRQGGQQPGQGGGRHPNDRHGQQQQPQGQGRHPNDRQGQQRQGAQPQAQGGKQQDRPQHATRKNFPGITDADTAQEHDLELGAAFNYNSLNDEAVLAAQVEMISAEDVGEPIEFNPLYVSSLNDITATARNLGLKLHRTPQRRELVGLILDAAGAQKHPIKLTGTLELLEDGNGLLVYGFDNYKIRELSAFIPRLLIKKHALLRGHEIAAIALPAPAGETAPMVVKVLTVMGMDPAAVMELVPFTELTPYYPTKRILLETDNNLGWDNLSMRCVDLLCPIGLGQRGLIVAPPRTGKTVLMQAMANAMARNYPEAHLIVLLVDERPEEVTDFKRNASANEVVSSTFDENAESHVHAAEMVIERARRMVECGRHVIILLDSITRLARAYNTMVPSSGKILSGGIEAGALTRPKRFFGSARNIEGGGSLTILGTALVDTGSKMDEVIFEEFKGTGNMELDLDRDLANKRIFPAVNFEKSGTRKEELLYHPDEMAKVYALRRAMKGVPSVEAMEMLIQRVKKTKTNAEFLVSLSR